MFARVTPFLLFSAFLLLLLVTLSAPIIDAIYLFRLTLDADSSIPGTSAAAAVQFGVFGYCVSDVEASVLGFGGNRAATCSSPRLGYTVGDTVRRVLRADRLDDFITRTTTAVLVLNPIATAFAFVAFLASLFMLRRERAFTRSRIGRHTTSVETTRTSRLASFLTSGFALLAALLATATFFANIAVVAILRNRLRDSGIDDIRADWGNGVWMTLGAAIALWIAVVGALCGICSCGRSRKTVY
jgi:hypothetical protein